MSKAWQHGSTRAWRRVRAAVLLRDGDRCRAHDDRLCAQAPAHQCSGRFEQAHHTRGRAVTGDDPRYIVASCTACNKAIGDPTEHADRPIKGVTQW
jgi:hypothetical protein